LIHAGPLFALPPSTSSMWNGHLPTSHACRASVFWSGCRFFLFSFSTDRGFALTSFSPLAIVLRLYFSFAFSMLNGPTRCSLWILHFVSPRGEAPCSLVDAPFFFSAQINNDYTSLSFPPILFLLAIKGYNTYDLDFPPLVYETTFCLSALIMIFPINTSARPPSMSRQDPPPLLSPLLKNFSLPSSPHVASVRRVFPFPLSLTAERSAVPLTISPSFQFFL